MRQIPTEPKLVRKFTDTAHTLHVQEYRDRQFLPDTAAIIGYSRRLELGGWTVGICVRGRVPTVSDLRSARLIVDFYGDNRLLSEDIEAPVREGLLTPARTVYHVSPEPKHEGIIANRLASPAVMRNPIELLMTSLGCQALERSGITDGSPGRAPSNEEVQAILKFAQSTDKQPLTQLNQTYAFH